METEVTDNLHQTSNSAPDPFFAHSSRRKRTSSRYTRHQNPVALLPLETKQKHVCHPPVLTATDRWHR